MRLLDVLIVALCGLISQTALAQSTAGPKEPTSSTAPVDPKAEPILKEINSLNAYQSPNLPLKTDKQYAHTVKELSRSITSSHSRPTF